MGKFTTRSFTDWQRYRLKQFALGTLRFVMTVGCSALTTVWIIQNHPDLLTHSRRATAPPSRVNQSIAPTRPARPASDSYTRYFDEALPILRADPNVRMVKIDMNSRILAYQESGSRLQASGKRIPMLAVSRSAQEFLKKMKLTYVDPRTVPADALKDATPVNGAALQAFLLVPEVSSEQASRFVFSRR